MKRPLFGLRLRPFKAALLTSRKAKQSGGRDRPQLIFRWGELFLHSLRIGRICEKLSTEGKTGFHTRKSEKQRGTRGHKDRARWPFPSKEPEGGRRSDS